MADLGGVEDAQGSVAEADALVKLNCSFTEVLRVLRGVALALAVIAEAPGLPLLLRIAKAAHRIVDTVLSTNRYLAEKFHPTVHHPGEKAEQRVHPVLAGSQSLLRST
jgi:hypothetical protein